MVTVTTSTTSSSTTLNGLSTGIDTTALVNAIVAQKGTGVARLKAQQTLNNQKTATLTNLKTQLGTLVTSMAALQDRLSGRVVTSTDSNNTNVTATATGDVSGSYDLTVSTVATRGRLSASLDGSGFTTNLAVTNPADSTTSSIFTAGTPATFAVQGTDGKVYKIVLDDSTNTLNGLRDKINAVAGASVTASVVNMGKGAKPYQLVLTAKDTGTGSTAGKVSIADITSNDGLTSANNLNISAGIVDNLTTPTKITSGGLTSSGSAVATDANFTLNGIALTRSTNVVKDAVDGMTITLKQGGQVGTTTLTVAQDTAGATTALQDFITKYNQLVKDYKAASTATKNADGSIAQAPLSNDATTRAMMNNLKATLAGASVGLPGTATYKSLATLGVTNKADGSLYLNTYTFQQAMNADVASVQDLFTFSGTSTTPVVTVQSGGSNTATGSVDFSITKDGSGILWGTLTQNGVTTDPIQVINGVLTGTGAYAGLNLGVTGTANGTLTLSRGAGQAASDFISSFTGTTGSIANLLNTITAQNTNLVSQIATGQARLDSETKSLKEKFAQMESIVGQMKATTSSLFGA
jgi:flagellar hook-associated protein 2